MIAATLCNVNGAKPTIRPEDVMPHLREHYGARPQSPEEMRRMLEHVTLEMGGTIARKGELPSQP